MYDGLHEVWVDGVKVGSTNVNYLNGTPSQVVNGINMISLGGNCHWLGYEGEVDLYRIESATVTTERIQ